MTTTSIHSPTSKWFGILKDGTCYVEVTTKSFTLTQIVKRMKSIGVYNGIVLDGSGSSQWYDGKNLLRGDKRPIFSYLLLWFNEGKGSGGSTDSEIYGKEETKLSTYTRGIDVSQWQKNIDWQKVKNDGIEFAMIRAGYGQGNIDPKFVRNISECNRLGIPCGIYWFSYAYTTEMAEREAQYALEAVKPYRLDLPIAFDYEGDSQSTAKKNGVTVTKELVSAMARSFCKAVENSRYYAMIYTNPDYLSRYFDSKIPSEIDIWLAQWPNTPNLDVKPAQAGGIWQYTSSGSVSGISGRVDLDVAYYNYPKLISANNLNGLTGGAEPDPDPEPDDKPITEDELVMKWVTETGISDGTNPDSAATRKQVWTMLYRARKEGKENAES